MLIVELDGTETEVEELFKNISNSPGPTFGKQNNKLSILGRFLEFNCL